LTIEERKRILLNNIYGVDIDPQAVEVTKLSLLLKVLEGETEAVQQQRLLVDRVLPDLDSNIKCGNSLIGSDFYEGQQLSLGLLDEEEMYRINVFDWRAAFPHIVGWGGFDGVIGNPPYIRIQAMKQWAPKEVEFYKQAYKAASKGNYDIYVVFVEKGLELLNKNGVLGFILPHKFFNAQYGEPLREIISQGQHLSKIVHFGYQQVFDNATTYTCLLFLESKKRQEFEFLQVDDLDAWQSLDKSTSGLIFTDRVDSNEWNFVVGEDASLFNRLTQLPTKLGDIADIFVGLQTSADKIFIMDFVSESETTIRLKSKALNAEWDFEKGIVHPLVSGTDVKGYRLLPSRQYILFPYKVEEENPSLLKWGTLTTNFPLAMKYLSENRKILEAREKGKFNDQEWYRFGRSQNLGIQERVKLCVPRLVEKLHAGFDLVRPHLIVEG
jgi:hypothetical protein